MALEDFDSLLNGSHACVPSFGQEGGPHDLGDQQVLGFFLATARCACYTQAARSLNVKATLLRRRLVQLSASYRQALFEHQGNAVVLSESGRRLYGLLMARRDVLLLPTSLYEAQPLVRVAVAEPLLHDLLGRYFLNFLRQHANARLDLLRLESDPAETDIAADIVVWLSEPQEALPSLAFAASQISCLAELEYLPHIGKRYSRKSSRPRDLNELQDYMLVSLHGYGEIQAFQPWNDALDQRRAGVTQVNTYELMCQMIQWSACVGLLPHYVPILNKALQPLPELFAQQMRMQVWMAVQGNEAHRPEVRQLVSLIQTAFDEHRDWL